MHKKLVYILLIVVVFVYSCKSDFEVNEGWKDITAVYGVLYQADSVHYIRLNRVFNGNSSAYEMSQQYDSISYNYLFNVKVEQWKDETLKNVYNLDTVVVYNKEQGIFNNSKQILYRLKAKLDYNSTYKLSIYNPVTKKLITSETNLVSSFAIEKPGYGNGKIHLISTTPTEWKWVTSKNGRKYEIVNRFYYKEKNIQTGIEEEKYIDWKICSRNTSKLTGGETLTTTFIASSFYTLLQNRLSVADGIVRIPGSFVVKFIATNDDLATYMAVNEPSNGVIQDLPEFTNINNGYGIFAPILVQSRTYQLNPESLDTLIYGYRTLNLGFARPTP